MDDPKRKPNVNVSSIAELKAELYRKQKESKERTLGQSSLVRPTPVPKKASIWSKQNAGVRERAQNDLATKKQEEDVMAKSRSVLEAKTRMYEKMTSGNYVPDEDGSEGFLVDFQRKAIDVILEKRENERRIEDEQKKKEKEEKEAEEERNALNEPVPEADTPDEEWVDYTDSFGRSRRCMKKDLPNILKLDQEIQIDDSNVKAVSDDSQRALTHMSADMRREQMRQKWEAEEEAALNKPVGDVHYANVQYDEIWTHGVGYYQFSKEEEERKEQFETLSQLREQTMEQRAKREKLKEKRKAIMDARLVKVKQRKFLREGGTLEEFKLAQEKEAELELAASWSELSDHTEPQPLTRDDSVRQNGQLREWDLGKKVVELDQWSKTKDDLRNERPEEFAPPQFYYQDKSTYNRKQNQNKYSNKGAKNFNVKEEIKSLFRESERIVSESLSHGVHNRDKREMEMGDVADIPLPPSSGNNMQCADQDMHGPVPTFDSIDVMVSDDFDGQKSVLQTNDEVSAESMPLPHQVDRYEEFHTNKQMTSLEYGNQDQQVEAKTETNIQTNSSDFQRITTDASNVPTSEASKKVKTKASPLPVHYSKPAMPCQPKKYRAPFVPLHSVPQSLPELPPTESAKTDESDAEVIKAPSYADWYAKFHRHYTKDFGEPTVNNERGNIKSANIPFVSPYVVQKDKSAVGTDNFKFLPMNKMVPPPGFESKFSGGDLKNASVSDVTNVDHSEESKSSGNSEPGTSLQDSIEATLKSLRSESEAI